MLDSNAIAQMVEEEIRKTVHDQVNSAVGREEWVTDLENQIVEFVQARIVARFSNISTVPDLVKTVENSVQKLFNDGFVPDIDHLIDNAVLAQAIDQAVENLVDGTVNNLTLDKKWIEKVQNLATQRMQEKMLASLRDIDLNQKLNDIVLDHKESLLKNLRKEFSSTGIVDNATQTELTIIDGAVVVQNQINAESVTAESDITVGRDLTVNGDLAIKGRINTDSPNWNELSDKIGNKTYDKIKQDFSTDLVNSILDIAKQGIDFASVQVNGEQLIKEGELARSVNRSHLTEVGKLKNLRTKGRVGINTDNPEQALSIWDDEISIGIGKQRENVAYVGTNKKQGLSIGVNQKNTIEISEDGDLWVKNLQIGRNKISHSTQPPGYQGSKGDVVFNVNYKSGEPFAWMCLGAFRWAELRA